MCHDIQAGRTPRLAAAFAIARAHACAQLTDIEVRRRSRHLCTRLDGRWRFSSASLRALPLDLECHHFLNWAAIPVARNVWLPIFVSMPATTARRRTEGAARIARAM